MQFEWDEAKNLENIRKHEIDFADVPSMFDGEMLIELLTRQPEILKEIQLFQGSPTQKCTLNYCQVNR